MWPGGVAGAAPLMWPGGVGPDRKSEDAFLRFRSWADLQPRGVTNSVVVFWSQEVLCKLISIDVLLLLGLACGGVGMSRMTEVRMQGRVYVGLIRVPVVVGLSVHTQQKQ